MLYVARTSLELMVVADSEKEAQAIAAESWRFEDLAPEAFAVAKAVRLCEGWDRSRIPYGQTTECVGPLLRKQCQDANDDDTHR